jgi:hypothetical protein
MRFALFVLFIFAFIVMYWGWIFWEASKWIIKLIKTSDMNTLLIIGAALLVIVLIINYGAHPKKTV